MFLAPFLHQSASVVAIISQMITPAIFILATGNLIASSITRVGRIVDQARVLVAKLQGLASESEIREAIGRDLDHYKRRSLMIERALTVYYGAVACFVVSSLFVAISVVIQPLVWVPTVVTVVGAMLVLYGAMQSLAEIRLATGSVRKIIDRNYVA